MCTTETRSCSIGAVALCPNIATLKSKPKPNDVPTGRAKRLFFNFSLLDPSIVEQMAPLNYLGRMRSKQKNESLPFTLCACAELFPLSAQSIFVPVVTPLGVGAWKTKRWLQKFSWSPCM